ncbi:MAG: PrsW family glutamic-type intramembrane protease [Clostridia bacterium]|nr:PrsW family glutamic-type intramembrane protease [Clostridia bacterium]
MLLILGALLSILAPVLFYRYILKGRESVNRKLYINIFLLSATLYTLPIIALELIWDSIFFTPGNASTVVESFAVAFTRAALLEEAVKFFFSLRVLRRHPELDLKEAILISGVVGIGYGFTEKFVYFNPVAMITNGLIPGHMVYQWIMGYFMHKALCSEGAKRRKNFILSFIIPFLIHGIWDFALDLTDYIAEGSTTMTVLGGTLVLAMIVLMIAGSIIAAKRIRKISE